MSKCRRKKECIYAMQDECSTDRKHCGYILIMREPRGCPADRCDKFKSKREHTREKQKQTKKGTAAQAAEHTGTQAVEPVGVPILQDDRGVQQ